MSQILYAQTLLNNRGPGAHLAVDKAAVLTVNHFVSAFPATNLPASNDAVDKTELVCGPVSLAGTSAHVTQKWAALPADGISIVLLGETHNLAADVARATGFVAALAPTLPTLVFTERGLAYPSVGVPANSTANESTITTILPAVGGGLIPPYDFGLGFSFTERNWAVAGYILACIATGAQNAQDRVLVFFGENHHQIWKNVEALTKSTDALYVQRRARQYTTIRSNNPAGFSTDKRKL